MGYVDTKPAGFAQAKRKMTNEEIGKKLFAIGKKNPCLRWQENTLIREAAMRLINLKDGTEGGTDNGGGE